MSGMPIKQNPVPRQVYFGPKDPVTGERQMELPAYVHQEYPRVMYHSGGEEPEEIVHNEKEEAEFKALGYQRTIPGRNTHPSAEEQKRYDREDREAAKKAGGGGGGGGGGTFTVPTGTTTLHLPKKG